jgi:chemotaxis protein CheC
MIGRPVKICRLRVKRVPIDQLTLDTANPEAETVGVYLLSGDDLPGQAILMLSLDDAMYMTDWLLEARPGTTNRLGDLEYSALAETGNLVLSAFLNAVAEFAGKPLRLSPPAVTVDMLATILETAVASVATVTDELLIIETDFINLESSLLIRFWMLPDPAILTANGEQRACKISG